MDWGRILAYITGTVDQELLRRNEYLAAENKILRSKIQGCVRLTDSERITLAKVGKELGRRALEEIATIVKPETILRWHRRLVARKFDGSKARRGPGRPPIPEGVEELILRFARENRSWGYDRIAGAMAHLGHKVSDQTVGNVLKRHGIEPAPERRKGTTWKEFIQAHMDVLAATDFLTVEVWTPLGLVTHYVLFFIHLGSRRVHVAGITPHPDEAWMKQIARNETMEEWGFLSQSRYLLHDRDEKFCKSFRAILRPAGVEPIRLPRKSPNLNAYAERWIRSAKEECLSRLIFFGEHSLRKAIEAYLLHYHHERTHQSMGNTILFPHSRESSGLAGGAIHRRQRLGGLLNYYHRDAA